MLRRVVAFAGLVFAVLVAEAQPLASPPGFHDPARAAYLDDLFAELAAAPDEARARRVEEAIWRTWIYAGVEDLDRAMIEVMAARSSGRLERALAILDRLAADHPEFPEVWNQRATVHFMRGDYERALADVAETLEREPRHFGALAGRGVIRIRQAKPALGYQSIRAAMALHPFLRERALIPEALR